ncbi:Lrp/AsnC family transcriptional regulator, partial [Mesorhizobium sp. M8A.F.Ca.ET.059.01.1.1]
MAAVTARIEREDLFVELTEKDRQLLALMQKN